MGKPIPKKEQETKRVALNLPEDLWERAKFDAIEERRPLAHILRDLLEDWLRERRKKGGTK